MIVNASPLRVSLAGGGTDLPAYSTHYGGSVISFALDLMVYVIIKPMFDEHIKVRHKIVENVNGLHELQHEIVRACLQFAGITKQIEVITTADVPTEGTGLGSSSALTVGLLHALAAFKQQAMSPDQLAEDACHVEIDLLRSPIGRQDQYISAFGGIRRFDFQRDGTVHVTALEVSEDIKARLSQNLLLFDTEQPRSANTILRAQHGQLAQNLESLHGIRSTVDDVAGLLRGDRDVDDLGPILDRAWQWKKQLSPLVSNERIDGYYARARAISSRIGGKLCGAGGGGFLLLYCPPEHQAELRETLKPLREAQVGISALGSRVVRLDTGILRAFSRHTEQEGCLA